LSTLFTHCCESKNYSRIHCDQICLDILHTDMVSIWIHSSI
jgi:hypothetical protein